MKPLVKLTSVGSEGSVWITWGEGMAFWAEPGVGGTTVRRVGADPDFDLCVKETPGEILAALRKAED